MSYIQICEEPDMTTALPNFIEIRYNSGISLVLCALEQDRIVEIY
jgi:hypothetical protein